MNSIKGKILKLKNFFNPLTIGQYFSNNKKFPKNFFGSKPWASKEEYLELFKQTISKESEMVKKYENKLRTYLSGWFLLLNFIVLFKFTFI